jgi:uncharacterized protein
MAIRVANITLSLAEDDSILLSKVAESLGILPAEIQEWKIVKKSLDARRKNRIHYVFSIECSLPPGREERLLQESRPPFKIEKAPPRIFPASWRLPKKPKGRPIIVGTGPAGLFAAKKLAENGLPPLILERGPKISTRVQDVKKFWQEGVLAAESNVQFGEGGAGTFSDGKLFTRLNDPRISEILETFVHFGAPSEILFLQRPHIGTDRLRRAALAFRKTLQEKGVEFKFQNKLTGLKILGNSLRGVVVNDQEEMKASILLLAIGHSARDTYQMLQDAGVALDSKPFAIGVRVEHPQKLIDRVQYGPSAGHPRLPPADYQLTYRTSKGRAVYSFCMCPGGSVIGASSQMNCLVTNGMSDSLRHSPFANSALVVNVEPRDFEGGGPLSGLDFQRRFEEKAFQMGGGSFKAPAQRLLDFIQDQGSSRLRKTSFLPGVSVARMDDCLPPFVAESLREAIPHFNRKLSGFSSAEAMLIGIETRTSAPVRILRKENFESQNVRGLYPIGEGSGYAGGIVSSALDGLKAAEAILKQFCL